MIPTSSGAWRKPSKTTGPTPKLLDLSDEALLADLKKRDLDPKQLALEEDIEHWGYHHDGHHDKHGGKDHGA